MSSFEFLVRLDYIEFKESFVVPKIGFRGWTIVPDQSYLERLNISVLLYELSDTRSTFHQGTVASNIIPFNSPIIVRYYPTRRNINSHDPKLSGLQVVFEGEFSANIAAGKYGVIIDAGLDQSRALSNQWDFVLRSETTRYQARGGFLSPRVSWLRSPFFILSGWAYREGDEIVSVDLRINDKKINNVVCGLSSKYLKENLLNVQGSERTVFAKIVREGELGKDNFAKWLEISTIVNFKSGEKLELTFPAFRVEANNDNNVYIESASVGSDGIARVSGSSMFGRVAVKTRNGLLELPQNSSKQNEHLPVAVTSRSFETGGTLGTLPGYAQIYLKTANGWKLAKPSFLQRHFRKTLSQFNYRFSFIKGVLNDLIAFCMRLYSPFVSIHHSRNAEPSNKRLFVASHNLSAVEGAPKVLLDIISSLDLGFEQILLISPVEGPLAEQWRAIGAKVEIVSDLNRAQELVYEFSPGLIYANTISSYWAVALANELKLPSIWSIHESVSPYGSMVNLPYELWMTFAQALFAKTKVCFVSQTTQRLYLNQCPTLNSVAIANGIDLEVGNCARGQARSELNLTDSDFVIICVGTTAYRKGQDVILKEADKIKEKINKNIHLYFVGARESDYLDTLRELAADLNVQVHFVPETRETEKFYLAADIKIIASREESAPLVSLEAMKYGVPIISTSVFGLAEQLEDRKTCLFFDPLRSGDLSDKVAELNLKPELRAELIHHGKIAVKDRFSKSTQLDNYRKIVSEVMMSLNN